MSKYFWVALGCLILSACSKNNDTPSNENEKGDLVIEFDNIVGEENLVLETGVYTNKSGEKYTIDLLQYYVSNIKLRTTDGREYAVPADSSYFLVRENGDKSEVKLQNVPAGDYNTVSFVVGVDSLRSVAPLSERTGVLDPSGEAADMYWTWNSGYVFLKLEGGSTAIKDGDGKFRFHIGGFGGYTSATINNLRTVNITAPSGMVAGVRSGKPHAPHIHLFADIEKLMDAKQQVSVAAHSMVMFDDFSATIANNYANMFSVDHIHND